jgi:8-oxo-dGTP diphosphatase / 2-hydroxy-dATP diphosphatase
MTLTLCLHRRDGKILLGKKKRGFGAGKWNGFGGKVEEGETVEQAARREMAEECGLTPTAMRKCGELSFAFEGNTQQLDVHVFDVTAADGEPTATAEMEPVWFPEGEIPFAEMWADDPHWMPLYLAGKSFRGKFVFADQETLARHCLLELDVAKVAA